MFSFSHAEAPIRCGAVIDVGSGSAGVAIVVSDRERPYTEVIWSHREHCLIKDSEKQKDITREINTAVVNALLELNATGLKALRAFNTNLKIKDIQVSISAPWAYTIIKTVNLHDEHPFVITEELLAQLQKTARTQITEQISNDEIAQNLGLKMLESSIINTNLNGYSITNPLQQKGRSLSLAHLHTAAISKLVDTLTDSLEKMLPQASVTMHSFMYVFYSVLQKIKPDLSEVCLLDVTSESTEIGILREGVLQYVTNIPYGTYSLARAISKACNIPKEEAYSFLKDDKETLEQKLSKEVYIKVLEQFDTYQEKVNELLSKTGDMLSIPNSIFLHCEQQTEELLSEVITEVARKKTGSKHTVHRFTSELLGERELADTALALSERFFHNQNGVAPQQIQ